jgi:small ligand-binding sensory domain FIST
MAELKIGVGLSRHPDTKRAALEAAHAAMAQAGMERAGWALCFFSMAHLPRADQLRELVLAETCCAALCGCSAHGLVASGEEVENRSGLAIMVGEAERVEARSALLGAGGEGLEALLPAPGGGAGPALLLAMPDAYRADARGLLARARQRPGLPLFGAGAVDDGTTGISLQVGMEGVRSSSVAALGLSGPLEVRVGITQSCHPVGEPHFITARRDNVILELDRRPAIHALIEQGQALRMESFQQLVEELLFGFPIDSQAPDFTGEACLVRHLIGFDQQSEGIIVPDSLDGQDAMIFMHRNAEQAERDMHRMVKALRERMTGPPEFGIYFDCAARGRRLYGREGVDSGVIREALGDFPLIGMLGGFEMATTRGLPLLYTYTGVLILVRGKPG